MFNGCSRWFEERGTTEERRLANKLDAAGWGLFFLWVGAVLLMEIGTGVGLVGVGVIVLGGQAARKHFNLRVEGFWVVVGLLFALGGLWDLFEVKLSLLAVVLILAGLALFVSAVRGSGERRGCAQMMSGMMAMRRQGQAKPSQRTTPGERKTS